MNTLEAAVSNPLAVWAGWIALVVLWESALVAALLGVWRAWCPAVGADAQYRLSLFALVVAVAGACLSPGLVSAWSTPAGAPATVGTRPAAAYAAAVPIVTPYPAIGDEWNRAAGLAGIAWGLGAVLMLGRVVLGWLAVQGLRWRATTVPDSDAHEALEQMRRAASITRPVELLRSGDVEAPVVVGLARPALIVPRDLPGELDASALRPLLAHECAHIRRRDYAVNLVQSLTEALFFFSPAVHWISRCVREAREYCCDELALRWCGDDRGRYVRVLTTLAALEVRNRRQPAVGAAGPRLITRVRRLIAEDPMPRRSTARAAGLSALFGVAVAAGWPVLAVSAAQAGQARWSNASTASTSSGVPIGWATTQPGSSVELGPVIATGDHDALSVSLHNLADVPVSSVTLVAVVRGASRNGGPGPITMVRSDPIAIDIAPGGNGSVRFLSTNEIDRTSAVVGTPKQVFIGLERVQYANGAEWTTTPNPAATTEDAALNLPPSSVPRRMIVVSPGVSTDGVCAGADGKLTSEGGVLPVLNEPGRYARCAGGVWVDERRAVSSRP
jgi:beta-lactamase regulating signal transducer with metallopeptidase domain